MASRVVDPTLGTNGGVKRPDLNSKRPDINAKRPDINAKRPDINAKRFQTIAQFSEVGADGDYEVTFDNDSKVIRAIAVRILANGELNLLTDEGRWFLFGANAWKTVAPLPEFPACPNCGATNGPKNPARR